ncbi:hypothetical protein [Ulvibacterium marinum]|uniref:Uncharacterized protein n=1 Tax=Ulvibacterium marinum TaxID=2419782 RepID=A0A3B0CC49_9FLAO|nr:hypothetical protein [Ulvibacterium marinum]RKN83553.1 hypothetical protein D7Z94_06970 [Ulvibacterium marinum]
MEAQSPTQHIKRTERISRSIVQSGTTIPFQGRNTKTEGFTARSFSLSNITISPILSHCLLDESDVDLRELAQLMVDVTNHFSGDISTWKLEPLDSYEDLILRCAYRLRERARIDHIGIVQDAGLLLILKRYIGRRGTVYCIPLRPIFRLKWKNPSLFHILLSFVKELPYIGLFQTDESRVDWIWQFLFEEEVYQNKNGKVFSQNHSVKFFGRYETIFSEYTPRDWRILVSKYRPRKPLHKKIKQLLLRVDTIDFNVPLRLSIREQHESLFNHSESFLIVDDEDSEFTGSYIEMLNECSNEYDIISAYEHTIADKENMEPFNKDTRYQLNRLEEFLSELNQLLRQL